MSIIQPNAYHNAIIGRSCGSGGSSMTPWPLDGRTTTTAAEVPPITLADRPPSAADGGGAPRLHPDGAHHGRRHSTGPAAAVAAFHFDPPCEPTGAIMTVKAVRRPTAAGPVDSGAASGGKELAATAGRPAMSRPTSRISLPHDDDDDALRPAVEKPQQAPLATAAGGRPIAARQPLRPRYVDPTTPSTAAAASRSHMAVSSAKHERGSARAVMTPLPPSRTASATPSGDGVRRRSPPSSRGVLAPRDQSTPVEGSAVDVRAEMDAIMRLEDAVAKQTVQERVRQQRALRRGLAMRILSKEQVPYIMGGGGSSATGSGRRHAATVPDADDVERQVALRGALRPMARIRDDLMWATLRRQAIDDRIRELRAAVAHPSEER